MISNSNRGGFAGHFKKVGSGLSRWWKKRPKIRPMGHGRPLLEEFESRLVLSSSISGTVFQTVDIVDPNKKTADPGISGIKVILDGDIANPQITDSKGNYTFADVTSGQQHTVSVQLPSNIWGFSAQALSYSITPGNEPFTNLNFALTYKTQALVQNLYQQVLVRSGDVQGFNGWTKSINTGAATGGQALSSFLSSSEFRSVVSPIATVLTGFFPKEPVQSDLLRNNIQIGRAGITQDANVLNILYSQPFIARYGDTSKLTNPQFVTFLYNTLLHRSPTSTEVNQWVNQMTRATNPLNRGQVVLAFTGSGEFFKSNPTVGNSVNVSLAYLGLLGRSADPAGYQTWVSYLGAGNSVASMGNRLLASPEFSKLKGFNDLFLADIQSYQLASPVNPLNRLQLYNPSTFAFDKSVTAGSLTGFSSGTTPSNVYVIAHGWAPGFAQDVLIHSTPGNPLKWWQTIQYPGTLTPPAPVSPWAFTGVDKVSVEGAAQAIHDADPKAQIILYSWVDDSGTPGNGAFSLDNADSLLDDVPYVSNSEANTQLNGVRMAEAIKEALGTDFFTNQGLIHLLGHSHGSRVATVAALTLQKANVPVTQLTTLESPEAGPFGANITGEANARNFLWYYMQQMNLSKAPLVGNSRTPNASTFIDNYWAITGVGMPFSGYQGLGSVVDVGMNPTPLYGLSPFNAHDYPPPWYGQSGLVNPQTNITTTMTGTGITSIDPGATVTVSGTNGFPGSGQDGYFIQIDNEIMAVTQGAGSNTWTLGARGLNGTTPATHTNLSSPVIWLQNNGLQWSPLINPTLAQNLVNGYVQSWSNFNFNNQFQLSPNPGGSITTPAPVAVQYATQYQVGSVTDTGNSLTLGVDSNNPLSLAALTFTPISMSAGSQTGKRGSGLSFDFQFTNPGEGDQLVVWERGLFGLSAPNPPIGKPMDTGSLGYRTVPLFVMTGKDAGNTKQNAILNLDAFFNNLATKPLALGMFHNSQLPTFGFSLIRAGNSISQVTVTNLQQMNDGTGP